MLISKNSTLPLSLQFTNSPKVFLCQSRFCNPFPKQPQVELIAVSERADQPELLLFRPAIALLGVFDHCDRVLGLPDQDLI